MALPLTEGGFLPFGDVVSAGLKAGNAANQGTAVRFDECAQFANARPDAHLNLAVFRSAPQPLPFSIKLLEKHPFSSQAFLPMVCARFLICVAPSLDGGSPDLSAMRAFVCSPGQGINYHVNVWHHPIIALDEPAEFAMLAFENGSADDCVEFPLSAPVTVAL